jgi:hypothetical protein
MLSIESCGYDKWLNTDCYFYEPNKKIKELDDIQWLKSRNLFQIFMNETSEQAKFVNALDCNVW